jgi:hypothetical protein
LGRSSSLSSQILDFHEKQIIFYLFFYSRSDECSAEKIVYLDSAWKETTKDKAAFFKPIPILLNDSIEFERVYFINGKLRYQGYSLVKKDYKEYIGSRYWYNENGFDSNLIIQALILKI